MATDATLTLPRQDRKVIGLISAGHFFSHFYMLLLPPLFPLLRDVYGVGFTELGFALAAFSVTTGLTQTPIGFLVDRYGARTILLAGLFLESIAIALIGVFPNYSALIALMVLAGLANAVYHPADYAILNASVDPNRMGRAFSIHTFSGFLGDALAPVTILFLLTLFDWQIGLMLCGLSGGLVGLWMTLNSNLLRDATLTEQTTDTRSQSTQVNLALLFSAPILMGLLFYVGIAMVGRGISGFSVSILNLDYQASLETAGLVLSAYLFVSPVGVLLGGWLADRVTRHDRVAAICFVIIGCVIFIIAATSPPLPIIAVLFALAGLCSGLVAPSRDMMIRSVTPPGAMGKVFGFVSTGFNIGGIIAPILFGYLLDHAEPNWVFWVVGVISLLTVLTVLETGRRGRHSNSQ